MLQTFTPDEPFLKEQCLDYSPTQCAIRAETLFSRCFGDREYIPQKFNIKQNEQEVLMTKTNMLNNGSQIIFTYEGERMVMLVYL